MKLQVQQLELVSFVSDLLACLPTWPTGNIYHLPTVTTLHRCGFGNDPGFAGQASV